MIWNVLKCDSLTISVENSTENCRKLGDPIFNWKSFFCWRIVKTRKPFETFAYLSFCMIFTSCNFAYYNPWMELCHENMLTCASNGGSQFGEFQSREWHISLANAFFSISIWREWNLDYLQSHMFCLLKIINLLITVKNAENLKLLWFEL